MKEDQASFTAMMVAYYRAYHSRHAPDKIFDDFLAYDLVPEDKREQIEQITAEYFTNGYFTPEYSLQKGSYLVSRARYTEDILEEAVRQGVKQYVILGAGMDTFAFRRPDLMESLKVFEVDHPATQKFKLNRLTELGWEHPENLYFIPIDFTKESLETVLNSSPSYDSDAKSFFSWLGVISYLTLEEISATLRSIVAIASSGSTLVFDYPDFDAFNSEKFPQMQRAREFLQNVGEPIKTDGFIPSNLAKDLTSLGLHLKENLTPTEIKNRYLKGYTDEYNTFNGHFACAIVK